MVKSSGFNGDDAEDPFYFDHFDVSSIGLYKDGQALPHRQIYTPDFTNKLFTLDYVKSMIQNTQHLNTNLNNGIGMDRFSKGYTFFTFNLTPDFDMDQPQLPRDGNLRLDIQFRKKLAHAINVIVYATFDSQLQITKDRQIIV